MVISKGKKENILRELTIISLKAQLLKMENKCNRKMNSDYYEKIFKAIDNITKILNNK